MAIRKVGVVGCGLMGSGIAQTCVQAGYGTIVSEVNQQLLDKGMARIHSAWDTLVSKGKLSQGQVDEYRKRVHGKLNLDNFAEAIYEEYKDPFYAPPPLLRRMVQSGMYGRKSGKGFYDYQ